jgi:hypothetical protein
MVFPYGRQNSRPFSHTRMFAHFSPRVSPRVHRQGGGEEEGRLVCRMAVFSLLFPDVQADHCHKAIAEDDSYLR